MCYLLHDYTVLSSIIASVTIHLPTMCCLCMCYLVCSARAVTWYFQHARATWYFRHTIYRIVPDVIIMKHN
ncbi:hypothetical protein bas19_0078 [Escherichia phage ChristophMerian]|nr:hypothetical protein bas19_0078 [Escherichia phage ChristophMerian]